MTKTTKQLRRSFAAVGLMAAGVAGGGLAASGLTAGHAVAEEVLFWSTQARPVEEAQGVRDLVLPGAGVEVDFSPQDQGPFFTRIQAELEAGTGTIGVIGGLHGEFPVIEDDLVDLTDVLDGLDGVSVSEAFVELGRLGSDEQKYLPWMQATYIMAANRQALDYLPEGADIDALTYDELVEWAATLEEETGSPKFGLPAGPRGLIHRFVQGYLYPSFTDSMVTEYRSDEAEAMWETVRDLWSHTSMASTQYNFMQEPLLSDDVWVAWDHSARLQDAFNQRPDDFVAFPAPIGPTGLGFMPVVAGIGIPATAPDPDAARTLVAHLMQPETQVATLRATSFFPVVDVDLPDDLPAAVLASGPAIAAQSGSEHANPGLLPVGLGDLGGRFNKVYSDTFERILLAGQDIRTVLDSEAGTLRSIMEDAGAPCWAPDESGDETCPVD